jgi:plasmid rolling circle replication initiator protein Rep
LKRFPGFVSELRLCPLCNWRRSLKLRYQLGRVLNVVFSQDDSLRMLLLTLTEPNSSWDDFGAAIGRLIAAIAKLMRYKRVRAAVRHSFRARSR